MNANEEMLAMLILMLVILMLILMLNNLNTGYADTDADLCIRIMSLCCILSLVTTCVKIKVYIVAPLAWKKVSISACIVAGDNTCNYV